MRNPPASWPRFSRRWACCNWGMHPLFVEERHGEIASERPGPHGAPCRFSRRTALAATRSSTAFSVDAHIKHFLSVPGVTSDQRRFQFEPLLDFPAFTAFSVDAHIKHFLSVPGVDIVISAWPSTSNRS